MTFTDAISLSADGRPVLVEFYATWCPHCQRMRPVVDQIREILGDTATVCQFDSDADSADAARAEVESLPTFIIYKDGREVWRQTGEMDGNVLLAKVESYT